MSTSLPSSTPQSKLPLSVALPCQTRRPPSRAPSLPTAVVLPSISLSAVGALPWSSPPPGTAAMPEPELMGQAGGHRGGPPRSPRRVERTERGSAAFLRSGPEHSLAAFLCSGPEHSPAAFLHSSPEHNATAFHRSGPDHSAAFLLSSPKRLRRRLPSTTSSHGAPELHVHLLSWHRGHTPLHHERATAILFLCGERAELHVHGDSRLFPSVAAARAQERQVERGGPCA
uniref:Uncharacterized protein n=1 Tax=Arundo donax TaxID=35708 RepID=A0A0A8Z5D4_ARUDO